MIIIAGFVFAVLLAIALGLLMVANIVDCHDDEYEAPEAEIDRAATSCWFGGNHFEI